MAQQFTPAQRAAALFAALALATPLFARLEGYEHVPYRDGGGVWTVCHGHTGKDIIPSKFYSDDECMALLVSDAVKAGRGIDQCSTVLLPPHPYAAAISMNGNTGGYCSSTMKRKLEAGDIAGGCAELKRWVYDKQDPHYPKPVPGLVNRREFEYHFCVTPDGGTNAQ